MSRGVNPAARRAEAELLLACARTLLAPGTASRIAGLVGGPLEWAWLVETALFHGLTPLLYRHLTATCPDRVPASILVWLRQHAEANSRRNLTLIGELLRLLDLLVRNGIPALPYKGPLLSHIVYRNLALRECYDLDILVPRERAVRARDVLLNAGYQLDHMLTPAQEARWLRTQYDFHLEHPKVGSVVELHWHIAPKSFAVPLQMSRLWQRARALSLGGTTVSTLSPEDQLLMLCVHGAKHGWRQLKSICDVAESLRAHPAMDWDYTHRTARAAGVEGMLLVGLVLAHDLLEAPLGETMQGQLLRQPTARVIASHLARRLFSQDFKRHRPFERWLFHLRVRERPLDKLRFAGRSAVTPSAGDLQLLALPAGWSFLYYLLRPLRLIHKYVWQRAGALEPKSGFMTSAMAPSRQRFFPGSGEGEMAGVRQSDSRLSCPSR